MADGSGLQPLVGQEPSRRPVVYLQLRSADFPDPVTRLLQLVVNNHIVWKLHDKAHKILAIRNYIRELSITFIVHPAYQNTQLKARPAPA